MVMRDLFATQAGMRFRRIDMSSEKTVAYVLKHERVHAIRDWMDLKRRISGPNRYCFGLFHLQMPTSPLVFVEVLVTDHLCDKVVPILDGSGDREVANPTHIIFYSISNTNSGLRELNTASHLLFLTIERMSALFPQCHTSATLSPVPGFTRWFQQALEAPQARHTFFTEAQVQRLSLQFGLNPHNVAKWLLKRLCDDWCHDAELAESMRPVLQAACARYVLFERSGDKMINPVANFHLQNGAQVEQINFLADPSPHGIKTALGMMINYRYCMTTLDQTSGSYKRKAAAAASVAVTRLVWPTSNFILDEIEKICDRRNIPLYARVYRPREKICARGSLPNAVYFICSGRVRVQSAHPYTLLAGSVYGHHEILNDEPVPYTLVTEAPTHAMLLRKEGSAVCTPRVACCSVIRRDGSSTAHAV
ncbi:hypothetical protein PINS_up003885 [Pythium insidiosum]|nr:hypothetical protein PINS_up003885 [Pythium insidiosum]